MDYLIWSQEYFDEAAKVKRNLVSMKKMLATVPLDEKRTLESKIQKLQHIYYELLETAAYLESVGKEKRDAA